jgi:hypothetical protein
VQLPEIFDFCGLAPQIGPSLPMEFETQSFIHFVGVILQYSADLSAPESRLEAELKDKTEKILQLDLEIALAKSVIAEQRQKITGLENTIILNAKSAEKERETSLVHLKALTDHSASHDEQIALFRVSLCSLIEEQELFQIQRDAEVAAYKHSISASAILIANNIAIIEHQEHLLNQLEINEKQLVDPVSKRNEEKIEKRSARADEMGKCLLGLGSIRDDDNMNSCLTLEIHQTARENQLLAELSRKSEAATLSNERNEQFLVLKQHENDIAALKNQLACRENKFHDLESKHATEHTLLHKSDESTVVAFPREYEELCGSVNTRNPCLNCCIFCYLHWYGWKLAKVLLKVFNLHPSADTSLQA